MFYIIAFAIGFAVGLSCVLIYRKGLNDAHTPIATKKLEPAEQTDLEKKVSEIINFEPRIEL